MPRLGLARIALGTLFLVRTTALGRLVHLPGSPPGIPLLGWPAVGGRFPFQTFAHLSDEALKGACVARTIAALAFTVGLWTRPAGFVAAALAYLVASQNPPAFTMTMHLFFLGMIVLACTDAAAELAARPRPEESPISSLGLVRVWTASIYAWAGIAKLNRDWLSGRVLGVWIDDHVVRSQAAAALIGTAKQRALIAPAVPLGELALGALLLLRPTRRPALLAAFALHAVFEVTIAPDMFGWAMAALLVTFLGDIGPWREVFAKRPRLPAGSAPLASPSPHAKGPRRNLPIL